MLGEEFYVVVLAESDPHSPRIAIFEQQEGTLPMKVKELAGEDALELLDILKKS